MGDTRGSAFTHQISPEPAAVLGLFFILLTILCFLLLSRVKNKHPLRVKLLYIGLLTAIIRKSTADPLFSIRKIVIIVFKINFNLCTRRILI